MLHMPMHSGVLQLVVCIRIVILILLSHLLKDWIKTYGDNYFNLLYALQNLPQCEVDLVAEETLTNPYLLQSINNQKLQVL
jgi:hypothetical protein